MAEDLYRKALDLANQINSKEDIVNAQISLAFLGVLTGKLDLAREYSEQAAASSRRDGNRLDELYSLLAKSQDLSAYRRHSARRKGFCSKSPVTGKSSHP